MIQEPRGRVLLSALTRAEKHMKVGRGGQSFPHRLGGGRGLAHRDGAGREQHLGAGGSLS